MFNDPGTSLVSASNFCNSPFLYAHRNGNAIHEKSCCFSLVWNSLIYKKKGEGRSEPGENSAKAYVSYVDRTVNAARDYLKAGEIVIPLDRKSRVQRIFGQMFRGPDGTRVCRGPPFVNELHAFGKQVGIANATLDQVTCAVKREYLSVMQ